MQSLDDDEKREVLGEVLADELKAIREYVSEIPDIKNRLVRVETDVQELKADMKVVKTVVTDQSRQLKLIDNRLTHLETARA